jgi:hypothetical protein
MVSFAISSSKHPRFDIIVGLDVAGKLFYCRKSTLLSDGASYFAARFGPDSMMDPERDHIAENGREIYFIDRNPEVFKYVMEYLRIQKLPPEIGTFRDNPNLWRALREEAEFFCLGGLISLLKATHRCTPDVDGGKGVLHWLGTNKGRDSYINPYVRGAVDVTGWFDSPLTLDLVQGSSARREFLVQHRSLPSQSDYLPWLSLYSNQRLPVLIDMRSIACCPSHYSLRLADCYRGMDGSWSFEGSVDGETWVLLHAGTNDGHKLNREQIPQRQRELEQNWLRSLVANEAENWPTLQCDYMERHHRHTWQVNDTSDQYFRYFRIMGADPVDGEGKELCFIGLEIYGRVYEH